MNGLVSEYAAPFCRRISLDIVIHDLMLYRMQCHYDGTCPLTYCIPAAIIHTGLYLIESRHVTIGESVELMLWNEVG